MENTPKSPEIPVKPPPKKRGRKKKSELALIAANNELNTIITETSANTGNNTTPNNPPMPKKRGRKPKGGKIIEVKETVNKTKTFKPNIILHLHCTIEDINSYKQYSDNFYYNPTISNIEPFVDDKYNNNIINSSSTDNINALNNKNIINEKNNKNATNNNEILNIEFNKKFDNLSTKDNDCNIDDMYNVKEYINKSKCIEDNTNLKEIWDKINNLSIKLHNNNIKKKSCCFWCTEPFDNPTIYIPKYNSNNTYHVYGSFCSPECATSYLFNEKLDNTTKFERYYLLNNLYSNIYDFNKNIKPAPSPYYLLDKYYGNLTIEEYRRLFRNDKIMITVDKPMTKIYPEIFEDNDEYPTQGIDKKNTNNENYRLSRKNTNKIKAEYLQENFGL